MIGKTTVPGLTSFLVSNVDTTQGCCSRASRPWTRRLLGPQCHHQAAFSLKELEEGVPNRLSHASFPREVAA